MYEMQSTVLGQPPEKAFGNTVEQEPVAAIQELFDDVLEVDLPTVTSVNQVCPVAGSENALVVAANTILSESRPEGFLDRQLEPVEASTGQLCNGSRMVLSSDSSMARVLSVKITPTDEPDSGTVSAGGG